MHEKQKLGKKKREIYEEKKIFEILGQLLYQYFFVGKKKHPKTSYMYM